jgi:hypothetical protein
MYGLNSVNEVPCLATILHQENSVSDATENDMLTGRKTIAHHPNVHDGTSYASSEINRVHCGSKLTGSLVPFRLWLV